MTMIQKNEWFIKMDKEFKERGDEALRYCKDNDLKPKYHKFDCIYKLRFYTFKEYYNHDTKYDMEKLNRGNIYAWCSDKIYDMFDLANNITTFGEKERENLHFFKIPNFNGMEKIKIFFDLKETELFLIYVEKEKVIKKVINQRIDNVLLAKLFNYSIAKSEGIVDKNINLDEFIYLDEHNKYNEIMSQ